MEIINNDLVEKYWELEEKVEADRRLILDQIFEELIAACNNLTVREARKSIRATLNQLDYPEEVTSSIKRRFDEYVENKKLP